MIKGVLTIKSSTVLCEHGGTVTTASNVCLQVNGNAVLVKESVNGKAIDHCPIPVTDKSNPCEKVVDVVSGFASKLKVNGEPVILEADPGWGLTNGKVGGITPRLLAPGVAGQTRLQAV